MFRGEVLVYDPPKVFAFTWGSELLRIELQPVDGGTHLVFTQVLSHPSVAARNGAGWHQCLDGLDALLGEAGPDGDWRAVYDDYLERIGPPLGRPVGHGAMVWERAIHVDADRVRHAVTDPTEIAAWGGQAHAGEPLHWEAEPGATGTVFRLRHDGIGHDAALAATWHALLLQLDMYLAAGQLVPTSPEPWQPAYAELLS
jgi:uncharacterized protein YndB with AHSA1/START domain